MTYAVIPDDGDRPTTLEMCLIPRIPEGLSVEEAAELWRAIAASELPDHAKARLFEQIEAAAGKRQPQPRSVVAGVLFCGAGPDEVMRQLKRLADQR